MKKILLSFFNISLLCLSSHAYCFYTQPLNPNLEYHLLNIRAPETQRSPFRWHMKKIGEQLGLAIAQTLPTKNVSIETLLKESATHKLLADDVVVVTILRAGLPLFDGILNVFPQAEGGFLVYQRDHVTLKPVCYAQLLPPLQNKVVILADPMIATAGSILAALNVIQPKNPKSIFVVGAIASKQGLQTIHDTFPNVSIFVGAADETLNEKGYIVPGLGDAGDRSYGKKE